MKAYKIHAAGKDAEGNDKSFVRYAGTQADARAARLELVELAHVNKKLVAVDDIDIPTAKAELLEFINGLVKS